MSSVDVFEFGISSLVLVLLCSNLCIFRVADEERAGCFIFLSVVMSCGSLHIRHVIVGWFAVCERTLLPDHTHIYLYLRRGKGVHTRQPPPAHGPN